MLIFSLLISAPTLIAQDGSDWYVYGTIKDHFSRKKMGDVKVTVMQDGKALESQQSSTSGKYEFFLPLDHKYELVFSKGGIVSKRLEIDTRNIPEEDRRGGFSSNLDMSLFEEMEGIDFSILDQPIGKGAYRPDRGSIEFDMSYTSQIQAELSKLMKKVEDKQKDEEKEEDQAAAAAAKLEDEFKKLMSDGKSEMTKKSYGKAVGNFEAAVKIKPDDAKAKSSLEEAKKALADSEAAAAAEENYKKAIDEGDSAMGAKNWQEAIDAYNSALAIKSSEKYPKDQIAKAEKSLADESKRLADEQAVAKLIEEGDSEVGKEEFAAGIDKFKEALRVIPAHKEATDKLASAQKLLADFEANKEKRDRYDAFIAEADGAFNGKEYDTAISKYEAALGVMSGETYPKDKIKEANDLLAAMKAAAEAEAAKAEQQAAFDALMASGESDMGAKSYDSAIKNFEGALDIFSDDATAKAKLDEAKKAKADAAAAAELEAQYNELIADADKAFDAEDYTDAAENYAEAIKLKDQKYPKDRLEEARRILETQAADAEAKRLAEEAKEKAAAEAADRQRQFDELVKKADDHASEKSYESAISEYQSALEIIADDAGVIKKIADAREALKKEQANMAQAELQAQYDAHMKDGGDALSSDEFDEAISKYQSALTVFEGDKKATAKLEEARNAKAKYEEGLAADAAAKAAADAKALADADSAAKQQQFDEFIAKGDGDFDSETFQSAIDNYNGALGIFPEDKKAKTKLQRAIDALANERAKQAKDAALADEQAKQAALDAQRAADEAARLERERSASLDEQYDNFLAMADKSFGEKEYRVAKDNYEEALSIRNSEVYPKSQIEKIERLLKEQEEEERLRAERLAAERQAAEERTIVRGDDLASSAEDEIDARMAEKRRNALQEKWDAMERDKQAWTDKQAELKKNSGGRIEESVSDMERYRENQSDMEERGRNNLADRTTNMSGYKEEIAAEGSRLSQKQTERMSDNKEELNALAAQMANMKEEKYNVESAYQKHLEEVKALEASRISMDRRGGHVNSENRTRIDNLKNQVVGTFEEYTKAGNERVEQASEEIIRQKKAIAEKRSGTGKENLKNNAERLDKDKERNADFIAGLEDRAKEDRELEREEVFSQETYAGGKRPDDFVQSDLAKEYPAGVTEETSTEGNTEVIRRIVVVGNKATEYRKVVSRTGTYYFKNGLSIPEHLWKLESDKVLE